MNDNKVEIGQKRQWNQSGRIFIVTGKTEGRYHYFYKTQLEDGSIETHEETIIQCYSCTI